MADVIPNQGKSFIQGLILIEIHIKIIHQSSLNYFMPLKHQKNHDFKGIERVLIELAEKRSLFSGENQRDVVLNQKRTRSKLVGITKHTLGRFSGEVVERKLDFE